MSISPCYVYILMILPLMLREKLPKTGNFGVLVLIPCTDSQARTKFGRR